MKKIQKDEKIKERGNIPKSNLICLSLLVVSQLITADPSESP